MTDVTREELQRRLGEDGLVVLDVRSAGEFGGEAGYPCDARQGHLPGARTSMCSRSSAAADSDEVRALVGAPEGAEVIAYCHSGSRSAIGRRRCCGQPGTRRATTSARGTSGRPTPRYRSS